MKVFSPQELNAMSDDERKAALSGGLGQMFSEMAHEHVTWIWWTKDTTEPTDILGHGSAFILDRGSGPMLVTAAHVYREYLAHQREYGALYCQVANAHVADLGPLLIGCGNLHIPLGEPSPEEFGAAPEWRPPPQQGTNRRSGSRGGSFDLDVHPRGEA